MGLVDKDRGYKRFARAMRRPGGPTIKVGIQGSEATEDHGGIPNVAVGVINEFGNPNNTMFGRPAPIPERSFMRSTFDEKNAAWLRLGASLMRKRAADPLSINLERLGEKMRADIQNKLASGAGDPPSAATLALRQRQGITADTQLVVSGQLKNSITSVVEGK